MKQHVWNCSVRGGKKLPHRRGVQHEALENMYVVAADVISAASKAIKESGLYFVDYVQVSRVTKLRGIK